MKCFLLLRNNVETGPFTLEELTAQTLQPTDLIWIEDQSVTWNFPTEIEALQPFVTKLETPVKEQAEYNTLLTTSKGIFVALPPQAQAQQTFLKEHTSDKPVELETRFAQPLETLRERYKTSGSTDTFPQRKTFSKPHTALWLVCVFAGLLLAAGLIKKMVEAYNQNASGIATAAAMPVHDLGYPKDASESDLYQNALTTEVIPVDTSTMKPLKKTPVKVNLKKLVQVDANDYQVGMFGGIKNLRLLVTNKSAFVLDKVKIELNYLKPNGDILKTENLLLKAVPAKSSKSLKVEPNKRGVKVAYHITSIESQQHANGLVSL